MLTGVFTEIFTRILGLRVKIGTRTRSLLQNIDVKSAFRQVGVAPYRAMAFAYHMENFIFLDLRLEFGWRGTPRWWGGDRKRNPESSSGDDVAVGEYVGGSQRSDEPRGRCGAGRGAVPSGVLGADGTTWRI